jgi:thiosulfate/3-mercaptopyruvate sulfurtransferase
MGAQEEATTRKIDPLVSTAWLEARLGEAADAGLIVIDIREPRLYEVEHIPGSISIPFSPMSDWAVSDDELLMELPPDDDLFALLARWGIDRDSSVVLVGTVEPPPAPPYALSDAPRVAATLFYAGVTDVAILEGGYPRWQAEGRTATREASALTGGPAQVGSSEIGASDTQQAAPKGDGASRGTVASGLFVSTDYVKEHLDRVVLLDGRDPDQYFGVTPCPFAGVGGHIPTARSLPAPWMWNPDGTYKSVEVLRAMAEGVIGADKDREVIAYCGVGGYAAAWWFVLTQILGYRDVKIYDGAAEAWAKSDPMVSYTW